MNASYFKIFVRWEKQSKYRSVGNEGWLTRCPFVISFLCLWSPVKMVYFFLVFSRLFVIVVSFFRLLVTVRGLAKWQCSEHFMVPRYKVYLLHKRFFNHRPRHFRQALVGCRFYSLSCQFSRHFQAFLLHCHHRVVQFQQHICPEYAYLLLLLNF